MRYGEAGVFVIAERTDQRHSTLLIVDILPVLEGRVEEQSLIATEIAVDTPRDPLRSNVVMRQLVVLEGLRLAPIHVVRELVEHDERGKGALRRSQRLGKALHRPGLVETFEALADKGIELRVQNPKPARTPDLIKPEANYRAGPLAQIDGTLVLVARIHSLF